VEGLNPPNALNYRLIAQNALNGYCLSSIAVSEG